MRILNVKRLSKDSKGNTLAFFEVDFGDHVIRDLRLVKTDKGGYFVSSPSRSFDGKDGKKAYFDFVVLKEDLKKMVTSRAIGIIVKGEEETTDEFDDIPE